MVTIDLDANHQLPDIFRKIESGEVVRLMRGNRLVALVTPAEVINQALWDSCNWDDDTWLATAAKESAKALADQYPNDDFSDWDPPDAAK
jgi:antitoxin (DNA-binding transcriptional repressor) of toxin-antitoxin stability system